MRRKDFIKYSSILGSGLLLYGCKTTAEKKISSRMINDDHATGHKIREALKRNASKYETVNTLIVGAGISGLTTAYYLKKNNATDFRVIELSEHTGGNSAYGKNDVSAFPWGAHYLPVPENSNTDLTSFLHENEIISHFDVNGLPHYREEYLCHDPDERLFIRNHWQDGIIPDFGLPENDRQSLKEFLALMDYYRNLKDDTGNYGFKIPVALSSKDPKFRDLDKIAFTDFLKEKKLNSEYLNWFVDYCCRDDYGTPASQTSAWAGIHYFAARRGNAGNATYDDVLTWPEGNGFLVEKLAKNTAEKITLNTVVLRAEKIKTNWIVDVLDCKTDLITRITCTNLVLSVPQFVCRRILKTYKAYPDTSHLTYNPWLIANITLKEPKKSGGRPLSWDNVIYGNSSLGYVNATHQSLKSHHDEIVITYYKPLTQQTPGDARISAGKKSADDWTQEILADLKIPHPDIEACIRSIDIKLWGHAMPRPVPGIISRHLSEQLETLRDDNIYFTHSDLSGISIFEEAFYRGKNAADELLKKHGRT